MKKAGRVTPKVERRRNQVVDKLFELDNDFIKHIRWSLTATRPCPHCDIQQVKDTNGNIVHKTLVPRKAKNTEGNCKFCNSQGYIPDEQQRNWAANQLGLRIAPAPKTVETSKEEIKDLDEFEQSLENKSKEQLEKIANELGVNL